MLLLYNVFSCCAQRQSVTSLTSTNQNQEEGRTYNINTATSGGAAASARMPYLSVVLAHFSKINRLDVHKGMRKC